ncbi:MAG: DUF3795 domain-containing protein [Parcubacteria group bacterium]
MMEEILIAPCGMNCGVCVSYLAMKNDLKKKGVGKKYCAGCLPRGKNCAFMKKQCDLLGKGLVRFCYECGEYPCRRLKTLDKRYRTNYHMSMIENLDLIKKDGIEKFLEKEASKWRCAECGDVICCHNGLCYKCQLEILRQNKKYRWDDTQERKTNGNYKPKYIKKPRFSLTRYKDERIIELMRKTNHKTLAIWAIDCAERVLPYFEEKYPEDHRPRNAIETLQTWINVGVFNMAVIRKASLDAHAAAREVGEDNAARSAARAAGQAVATAHVPTHSIGAATYALKAIHRATNSSDADATTAKERAWQYQHLLELTENDSSPPSRRH